MHQNTPFKEWAHSFRYFFHKASQSVADTITGVEEEKVWHSGVLAGIGERFPQADVVPRASRANAFEVRRWWRTSRGSRLGETLLHWRAPRSTPRAVRLVGRAESPALRTVSSRRWNQTIRKWEDRQRTLMKEIRNSFSDKFKVGILLHMLPKQAHDFVFQALGSEVTNWPRSASGPSWQAGSL